MLKCLALGKTVLSSTVIGHLEMLRQTPQSTVSSVLYFFCSYRQPDKNTCLAILRSFIYQIILQDEQLISYVYEQYIASPHCINLLICKKILNFLLDSCAPSGMNKIFMVIDGLDELPEAERVAFLPILKQFLAKGPYKTVLRLFIASQNLLDIRKVLSRTSTLISVGDNNKNDIRKYVEAATAELVEDLGLDEEAPGMSARIVQSLTERAGGRWSPSTPYLG
jgi:hypothetical protein